MKHPSNRAERRHVRERIITARKFVWLEIWNRKKYPDRVPEWGIFTKWNMNCGCTQCHYKKYLRHKRKRREELKNSWTRDEEYDIV